MYKPELKLSEMISRHGMIPGLTGHDSSSESSRADSLVSTHSTLAPSPPHAVSPTDTMGSSLGVSPVLGGLTDEGVNKRRRNQLKPYQLRVLNRVLEHTAFPTKEVRDELSRMINVPPKSIQIWFQNQRQKAKSQMREARQQQQQQPRTHGNELPSHVKAPLHFPVSSGALREEATISWQDMMALNSTSSYPPAVPMQAPSSAAFIGNTVPPYLFNPSNDISPFLVSPSMIPSPLYDYHKVAPNLASTNFQKPEPLLYGQIGHHRKSSQGGRTEAINLLSPIRSPAGSDILFAAGQLPPLFEEIETNVTPFGLTPSNAFKTDFSLQSGCYYYAPQDNSPAMTINPNGGNDFFDTSAW